MTSYKQLLEQRESLELQIREAKKRETGTAIAQVRALISEFGLTAQDVFPSTKARVARAGAKVAAKYRNTATGQTWTGRGKGALVGMGGCVSGCSSTSTGCGRTSGKARAAKSTALTTGL